MQDESFFFCCQVPVEIVAKVLTIFKNDLAKKNTIWKKIVEVEITFSKLSDSSQFLSGEIILQRCWQHK